MPSHRSASSPSRNDPVVRYRPNEKWIYSAAWDFFIVKEVRTNNAGWVSDIDYVRDADTPLVAFVGDSFVQGDHLPWQQVFVYRGDSTSAEVGAEFFLNSHAEAY